MTAILALPHFQQSADGYCLPACARMVLAYCGQTLSEADIRHLVGAKSYGTPAFSIVKLEQLHLAVKYREWSVAELFLALQAGDPLIVFVRTGMLEYWQVDTAHALVIVGVEEERCFWVHDPFYETGPFRVDWNSLLAAWAEFSYRGALIKQRE